MSIDAVALVRIPEWEPPEDADVRELDDGALVFLAVPFGSEPDEILDALEAAIGDALYEQDDERGVFILPDASEPEDVETYEEVIAAVGEDGKWVSLEGPIPAGAEQLLENPESLLGHIFEAMGVGNGDDIMRAMRDGDQDALKLAQIQMTSALERLPLGAAADATKRGSDAEAPPDEPDGKKNQS